MLPPHLLEEGQPSHRYRSPEPKAMPTTQQPTPPACLETERFFRGKTYEVDGDGLICNPCPSECFQATTWPRILVISMFDGIGGIFEALHSPPVLVESWAAETASVQRTFVQDKWPQITTVTDAAMMDRQWV